MVSTSSFTMATEGHYTTLPLVIV